MIALASASRVAHRYAAEAMVATGLKADAEAVYRARMRAFRTDPTPRHIDAEVSRDFRAEIPNRNKPRGARGLFQLPCRQAHALFRIIASAALSGETRR